jgi:hypothetical protein
VSTDDKLVILWATIDEFASFVYDEPEGSAFVHLLCSEMEDGIINGIIDLDEAFKAVERKLPLKDIRVLEENPKKSEPSVVRRAQIPCRDGNYTKKFKRVELRRRCGKISYTDYNVRKNNQQQVTFIDYSIKRESNRKSPRISNNIDRRR